MKILVTSLPDLKKIPVQRPHHLLSYCAQNHQVTVLCTNAPLLEEQKDEYLEKALRDIRILYLTEKRINPLIQELGSIRGISSALKESRLADFDLHLNFNSLILGYFTSRRMKKLRIPTVFDICDDLIAWIRMSPWVPGLLKPMGELVGKRLLKESVKSAARVTYPTELLNPEYSNLSEKFELIPNGVDTRLFFNRTAAEVREGLGLHQQDFIIGFVGALQEWVDLEPVFMAVGMIKEEHPNFKLLIVGDGAQLQQNKELAYRLGIADRVIFSGHVPYQQVPIYISGMDVCVLPFKTNKVAQNAMPLKLFEYMACEKPVVATPLAAVREAVGDRVFYAANAEEFKQRILELYRNEELRMKLGKEGRAFVGENYTWENICRKFEKLLLEVAGGGKQFAG